SARRPPIDLLSLEPPGRRPPLRGPTADRRHSGAKCNRAAAVETARTARAAGRGQPCTARFPRAVHAVGLMQEIDQPSRLDITSPPRFPGPRGCPKDKRMRSKRATTETSGRWTFG